MRSVRVRALLGAAAVIAALAAAPAAHAGCGLLGLDKCAAPPAPPSVPDAPDPGGNATAGLTLPPPSGKLLGFSPSFAVAGRTTAAAEVGYLARVDAGLERYTASWRGLQPQPSDPPLPDEGGKPVGSLSAKGSYLDRLDQTYLELRRHGMRPIITLLGAPAWATDYAHCGVLDSRCKSAARGTALPPNSAHIGDWRRFVTAIAERYPAAAIEPWNEPNIKPFWDPQFKDPDPVAMANLQCQAYSAVKAAGAPNAVLSAAFAGSASRRSDGSPDFEQYLDSMYGHGLKGCMDRLSVHIYPGNTSDLGPGSAFAIQFAIVRRVRARYADTRAIWVTETGSSSFSSTKQNPWGISEAQQADINVRLYNKLMTMGDVDVVAFHALRDPVEDYPSSDPGAHYGFMRGDWSAKPVWCAFVAMAGTASPGC